MSRPVTAAMAVQCIDLLQLPGTSVAMIRKWAERGHVKKYGVDQTNCQRYELHDIIRMVSTKAA